jgi:hypothetical protein
MDEPKVRKPRADKGVPRGPRPRPETPIGDPQERMAPINVRVLLKGAKDYLEFGCATRTVENGFHVFTYPSEIDRWRQTRREIAVSEVVDLQITEAPQVYDMRASTPVRTAEVLDMTPHQTKGPMIYSPRKNRSRPMGDLVERLAQSNGTVAIGADELSGALGVGASVTGIGDSTG